MSKNTAQPVIEC